MPSYYDSSKKKPGKAKVKYAEGGKVKKGSNLTVDGKKIPVPFDIEKAIGHTKPRRSDPEKRESVRKRAAERKKERELEGKADLIRLKVKSGKMTASQLAKLRDAPEKMNKGGQLKVTGMGAATRGGNFTRNG